MPARGGESPLTDIPSRTRCSWRMIWPAADSTGRLLLGGLLSSCSASGARQVIAVIAGSDDPASTALHTAFGFVEAGRLEHVGYKHGRWIDTLLMQRSLP